MAHFAELDDNNIVTRVIVISNDDIKNAEGTDDENIGIELCKQIAGSNNWVQTSYNNNFRKQFGQPGFLYDKTNNVFISPQPASWFYLNDNFDWVCDENINPTNGLPFTSDELLLRELNIRVGQPILPEELLNG
jgi:hypothetical protein